MNFYVSVLKLDRKAHKSLKITDIYSLHRVVYDLFLDNRSEDKKNQDCTSGIQWVDQGGDHEYRQILILSNRAPNERNHPDILLETKIIPSSFLDYSHYSFDVVINPTRRDQKTGKLRPIKDKFEISKWFTEKALKNWGFLVHENSLQIYFSQVQQFRGKSNNLITVQQTKIRGELTVTDQNSFHKSFTLGIGRNRSFGCGLLKIVPIV